MAKIGRTKDMIVNWMNKFTVSNSKEIGDCEKMKKEARTDHSLTAAYFGPYRGDLYSAHVQTSINWSLMEDWKFVHLDDPMCADELGVAYPGLSLYRFFDRDIRQLDITDGSGKTITAD